MRQHDWQRAAEIFDLAAEVPAGERSALVAELCGEDADLRGRVEALLADYENSADFLEDPLVQVAGALEEPTAAPELGPGSVIGPYRLVELMEEGGMGVVWKAVRADDQYDREVAIKLVRRDLVTPEIVRRFRAERQILARLEHPGIARLYDGGETGDGQPFLVMELIDGLSLTEYCDQRQLGVDERLALFGEVCDAVQYAHNRLLIHCDLKPGNILVGADGRPRLVDFGIARLLGSGAEDSRAEGKRTAERGSRPMTPRYASPEQRRGEPLTTASDVYSLGVVLFRLLTGRLPDGGEDETGGSRSEAPSAALSRSRPPDESEGRGEGAAAPASLRHLRRRLKGDLDAIVLKATRPRAEERYRTVEQLSADLLRHRNGQPVEVRSQSLAYLASRFVRRHAVALAALLAVVVALAATAVYSTAQAREVSLQRVRAEQFSDFLVDLFQASGSAQPFGQCLNPEQLLALANSQLSGDFDHRPDVQAKLLDTMGMLYHGLGRSEEALELVRRGLDLRLDAYGENHADVGRSRHNLAAVLSELGQVGEAEAELEKALAIRLRRPGMMHLDLADTLVALGQILGTSGRAVEAESMLRDAVQIQRHAGTGADRWAARSLRDLGNLLLQRGALEEAEELLLEALEIDRKVSANFPPRVAAGLLDLVALADARGEHPEAVETASAAVELNELHYGDDHPQTLVARAILARHLGLAGRYEEAEALFRSNLAAWEERSPGDHPELATALNNLAVVLTDAGRFREAEEHFRQALEMRRRLFGEDHPHVAQARYSLGRALHGTGDLVAAEALYRQALSGVSNLPERHPALTYPRVAMAGLMLDRGEAAEALRELRPLLRRLRASLPVGHWRIAAAEALLGEAQVALGEAAEGALLLRRAQERLLAQRGRRDPRLLRAQEVLSRLDEGVAVAVAPEPAKLQAAGSAAGESAAVEAPVAGSSGAHLLPPVDSSSRRLSGEVSRPGGIAPRHPA